MSRINDMLSSYLTNRVPDRMDNRLNRPEVDLTRSYLRPIRPEDHLNPPFIQKLKDGIKKY